MSIQNSYQLFHDELELHKIYEQIARPIIIADNIRSPENMGAILRLAGNIGVLKSLFISDDTQEYKNHKISRTASGGAEKTSWQMIQISEISKNLPADYQIVALETTADAENIYDFSFPQKTAFLIGNEVSGIKDEILTTADHKVYIPIPGPISSLNVTHALSIGLFFWLQQHWK